jgi:hypothetical protein
MKKITLSLICLALSFASSAQDNCASALTVIKGATTTVGTINGVADNTCGWTTAGTAGEWYTYTATGDGAIKVSANLPANSGQDTRVSIYTGNCGSLICLAANDDVAGANYLSEVTFPSTNGTTYYILWDNRWEDTGFDFILTETVASCESSLPIADTCEPASFYVCWTNIDDDGDTFDWFVVDYDLDDDDNPDGNPCFGSASWDGTAGALTPDNWLISNAVDLTGFSTSDTVELTWKARGIDATYADENYTVYVATGNTIPDFTSSSVSFNEIIGQNGGAGVFADRTLDIASLAGNMVYIAFRHHGVSDQFVLNIDDVGVDFTLGVNDFEKNQLSHFYNKTTDILKLESSVLVLDSINIYNLLGQNVISETLSNFNEDINLTSLSDGVYIAKIKIGDGEKTLRILKQ